MATWGTSSYGPVDPLDSSLLKVFRRFYCKSDVSSLVEEAIKRISSDVALYSRALTVGKISLRTWFEVRSNNLYAWSDSHGYGPVLLYASVLAQSIDKNSHYAMSVQWPYILNLDSAYSSKVDLWLDKSLSETSPFTYRVNQTDCVNHVSSLQLSVEWYSPLCFKLANYLNRLPTREELTGKVLVPISPPKISNSTALSIEIFSKNENYFGTNSVIADIAKADPVESIPLLTFRTHIDALRSILLVPEVDRIFSHFSLLDHHLVKGLTETRRNILCYEDRLSWYGDAAAVAKPLLDKWLFSVIIPTPLILVEKIKRNPKEGIKGSWGFIQANLPDGRFENFLLNHHAPLNEELFRDITYSLIADFKESNPSLSLPFVTVFLAILQILAKTRTNSHRHIARPLHHKFEIDEKIEILDFSCLERVFTQYQSIVPNIERSYGACCADIVFDLLKYTGGSNPIWYNLPEMPSHMNFDFVTHVTPLKLSPLERQMLVRLIDQFRTKKTKIGGNTVGNRRAHPMDAWIDAIVPKQSQGKFQDLLGIAKQVA